MNNPPDGFSLIVRSAHRHYLYPAMMVVIILIRSAPIFTQVIQTDYRIPTAAVPFMRLREDAQASGMGDAAIATDDDHNALFSNNAKYAFLKEDAGVSFNFKNAYNFLLSGSGYYRFGSAKNNVLSAALIYNSYGNSYNTISGQVPQTYHPFEYAVIGGYTRKVNDHFSYGMHLKYIYSSILTGLFLNGVEMQADGSIAGGLNCYYHSDFTANEKTSHFSFGATIDNLGSRITYDGLSYQNIPANFGIGAAYAVDVDEQNQVLFTLDLNKLMTPTPSGTDSDGNGIPDYIEKGLPAMWISSFYDAPEGVSEELKEVTMSAGAAYSFEKDFFIRAGFFYENPTKGGRKYYTLGAGIHFNDYLLDIAYLIPATSIQTIQQPAQQKVLTVSLATTF